MLYYVCYSSSFTPLIIFLITFKPMINRYELTFYLLKIWKVLTFKRKYPTIHQLF